MRSRFLCGVVVVLMVVLAQSPATAALVGPSVDATYTGIDSAGQRINVDQSSPLVLAPGTYLATDFSFFAAATSSNTTPFLVINADPSAPNPPANVNQYSIIAVGSTITAAPVPGTNVVQTVPFGGGTNAQFTLTTSTKVFAAVSSGTADQSQPNAIGYKAGSSVDHHNPGLTAFTPTVGSTTPTFTNADLNRLYGFSISVTPVPEPACLGILAVGAIWMIRRRPFRSPSSK